ncbi:MAG: LysR family transcriptional regulator [Gammaproteobacteria bacterium]|nr:LysR family transcriptional regulator [Gammaproteobacteria bacterium]
MDRFEDLQTFILVAEHRSIRKAADLLNRAPSAVSRRVKDLEQRLEVQLLTRTTRQVRLTPAGERFLEKARKIIEALEEAEASATADSHSISGELRITVPLSFGIKHLAPAISDFMTDNPRLKIDADFNDTEINITSNRIDLAIRIGYLKDSTLRAKKLAPIHHVVAAAPSFWKKHGIPRKPSDLTGLPGLCYSNSSMGNSWSWSNDRGESGKVVIEPRYRASNGEALVHAATMGFGVVRLPTFLLATAIEAQALQPVLLPVNWGVAGLYALYADTAFLPSRSRSFIDFLGNRFGDKPDWDECLRKHLKRVNNASPIKMLGS